MFHKWILHLSLAWGCLLFPLSPQARAAAAAKTVAEPTSYRDVVKKVLPAVVSIETRTKMAAHSWKPFINESEFPQEFGKTLEPFGRLPFDLPGETWRSGLGSGFVVDGKGVIVTNWHVVQGAQEVVVRLHDGSKFVSTDVKSDPRTDLAIVRIDAKKSLPYLEFADSNDEQIGDRVLAVGAPFGLTGSVTTGIVSAKGRNLNVNTYDDFLQTDAAINPGNSGGPLVNLDGKVVGVNTMIKTDSGRFEGVGLAIASNLAKNVTEQLEQYGLVHRGYLGVEVRALDPDVAARLRVPNDQGVLVARVQEDTPAAKAGIQAGDIITLVAGKPMKDTAELQRLVAGLPLKKAADVTVLRDGKTMTLHATIEEQPKNFGLANEPKKPLEPQSNSKLPETAAIGITVADLTPQLAKEWGYDPQTTGVVITSVTRGTPAADAGLHAGDLIRRVDDTPIRSADEAKTAMKNASLDKGVLFKVQTQQHGVEFVMMKEKATH